MGAFPSKSGHSRPLEGNRNEMRNKDSPEVRSLCKEWEAFSCLKPISPPSRLSKRPQQPRLLLTYLSQLGLPVALFSGLLPGLFLAPQRFDQGSREGELWPLPNLPQEFKTRFLFLF